MFKKNVILPTVITVAVLLVLAFIPGVGSLVYEFLGAFILVAAVLLLVFHFMPTRKTKKSLTVYWQDLMKLKRKMNNVIYSF